MDSEEKIFLILNIINEKINISVKNTSIFVDFTDIISKEFIQDDIESIMAKLKKDEKIINDFEFLENLMRSNSYNYWCMVEPNYDKFAEYFKSYKVKNSLNVEYDLDFLNKENIAYKLKYSDWTHEILINNFLLATPRYDSPNRYFFEYVYNNPNRNINKKEIMDSDGEHITKNIRTILNELGFIGDLKIAFFHIATDITIHFRNPVYYKDLQQLNIKYIKFPTQKITAKKDS